MGFQHRDDAEQFLADLRDRFAQVGLELHPDKTRLIEFGRLAAADRRKRGDGQPETFGFLGFTHACVRTRNGRFRAGRVTDKKRMRAKRRSVRTEMRRRMHLPIREQGAWLRSVFTAHLIYWGLMVLMNTMKTTHSSSSERKPDVNALNALGACGPLGASVYSEAQQCV